MHGHVFRNLLKLKKSLNHCAVLHVSNTSSAKSLKSRKFFVKQISQIVCEIRRKFHLDCVQNMLSYFRCQVRNSRLAQIPCLVECALEVIRISIGNIYTYSYFIDIFYRYLLKTGYHSRREVRTMAPPAARTERDGNIPNGIQNEVMALHYFFSFLLSLIILF